MAYLSLTEILPKNMVHSSLTKTCQKIWWIRVSQQSCRMHHIVLARFLWDSNVRVPLFLLKMCETQIHYIERLIDHIPPPAASRPTTALHGRAMERARSAPLAVDPQAVSDQRVKVGILLYKSAQQALPWEMDVAFMESESEDTMETATCKTTDICNQFILWIRGHIYNMYSRGIAEYPEISGIASGKRLIMGRSASR